MRTWTQKKTLDKLNKLPLSERNKELNQIKRKNYLLYCKRNGIVPDPDLYKNKNTKIKPTDSLEEKREKCLYNIEYYKTILESLNESDRPNIDVDICSNSNSGSEKETC